MAEKVKKPLTEEEKAAKKKHIKEEVGAWLGMIFFVVIFLAMFAFYGMQSSLFGG